MVESYGKFIQSVKADKPRLYSTLVSCKPFLSGKETIEFELSNQNQHDDFIKNLRSEMIKFLRDELLNDNIVIEIKISEVENQNMLYTSEEKFKHLLSKNPSLGNLKQQMNLDFD
jgi:DNA polymerase III subunit gamma/tau